MSSILMSEDFDFSKEELKNLGEVMAELAYLKNDPKMAMVAYSIDDFLTNGSASDFDAQKQAGIY